jgi:pimeloyl-ACP methyl ester carboxylesterase
VELHWVEYGRPTQKTPLVLLHGLNDSHLTWRQIAPELARDRRVLALDLPGHGLSGRPDAGYELVWYTRLVDRWMRAIGLTEVDMLGHSFGGGIALTHLRVGRTRIRRLVLAAPGGLGKEVAFVLRLAAIPGIVERFGQPFMALGTWLALGHLTVKLPRGHLRDCIAMNARSGTARAFARTVRNLVDWRGQRHSFLSHAHKVDDLPPIAVLWGDRDEIVPMAHGKALVHGVEGARLELFPGCGHFVHHDDPASFCERVRGALDAAVWPAMRLRVPAGAPRPADPSPDSLRLFVPASGPPSVVRRSPVSP